MRELSTIQGKLLKLLKEHETDPLTMRELKDELQVSSPSVVFHHIQQLERKGFLRRNPSNPNDYQVLTEEDKDKKVAYLNLYGMAQCGPRGVCLEDNPIDQIPISTRILGFPSTEAFLVKAKGTSMYPKINNGDLVIARRADNAKDGELVVCVNNGEVLIKQLKILGKARWLFSENSEKFKEFEAADDFRVVGIVRGILSYSV